jgi:hypothetical protein
MIMINEETLYALIQTNDPNSLMVAQDLAIEMSCGLPISIIYKHARRYFRAKCGRFEEDFSWATKKEIARSLIEIITTNEYGRRKIYSYAGRAETNRSYHLRPV